jgi:MraZ protein
MFRGRFEHTIDAKGRTSVPSRFREILAEHYDERLIITQSADFPCLSAWPYAEWRKFEERVMALPHFDPAVVTLKRLYISPATECPIDQNGRILIPPHLRDHAGLERDLIVAGMVDTFEIWAKQRWEAELQASRDRIGNLGSALAALGL